MKPAWDQLGDAFAGSDKVLIGDVDCTVHDGLCAKFGVQGYPTIKYFVGNDEGEDYQGGRDFDSLKEFADNNLGPSCSFENLDLCDADKKAFLEEWAAKPAEDLAAEVQSKKDAVKKAETDFEKGVEGLQKQYEQMMKDKDETIKAIKPNLGLLKSIKPKAADGEL